MTTPAEPVVLYAPDPDPAGGGDWPAPVRHRVARLWLADRVEEAARQGARVTVVVPADLVSSWRGLAAWLRAAGPVATVRTGMAPVAGGPAAPTDTEQARAAGGRCAALFGPGPGTVRYLGLTVAGTPGAPGSVTGPWPVLTDEGWRATLHRDRLGDPVLELRPGQRLHALVTEPAVGGAPVIVSAWH